MFVADKPATVLSHPNHTQTDKLMTAAKEVDVTESDTRCQAMLSVKVRSFFGLDTPQLSLTAMINRVVLLCLALFAFLHQVSSFGILPPRALFVTTSTRQAHPWALMAKKEKGKKKRNKKQNASAPPPVSKNQQPPAPPVIDEPVAEVPKEEESPAPVTETESVVESDGQSSAPAPQEVVAEEEGKSEEEASDPGPQEVVAEEAVAETSVEDDSVQEPAVVEEPETVPLIEDPREEPEPGSDLPDFEVAVEEVVEALEADDPEPAEPIDFLDPAQITDAMRGAPKPLGSVNELIRDRSLERVMTLSEPEPEDVPDLASYLKKREKEGAPAEPIRGKRERQRIAREAAIQRAQEEENKQESPFKNLPFISDDNGNIQFTKVRQRNCRSAAECFIS